MSGAARCASDAASQSARRYVKGRHDLPVAVALIPDKTGLSPWSQTTAVPLLRLLCRTRRMQMSMLAYSRTI